MTNLGTVAPTTNFSRKVWDTLSQLDVTDHIDHIKGTGKRPDIAYLSWSSAWALLKRAFPASRYQHFEDMHHQDGTVEVEVDVLISLDGEEVQGTNARLAVMDNRFNPIQNPSARQINDARQRALVKALAFAGLGLNLWSDSSIPVGRQETTINPMEHQAMLDAIGKAEMEDELFLNWCGVDDLSEIEYSMYKRAMKFLEAEEAKIKAAKKAEKAAEKAGDVTPTKFHKGEPVEFTENTDA